MSKSKPVFTLSLLISLFINLIFPLSSFAQYNNTTEEIMTFETYYPAPFGVYNEMRSKKMAIGDNYYNGSQYCWSPATCSNQIDGTTSSCWPNCNTDLVVEGNVGIGTTSPDYKLSFGPDQGGVSNILAFVDEASPNNAMRGIGAYNSGGVYGLAFWASLGDAATVSNTRMFIDANTGNVGIGTTTPKYKLSLGSDAPGVKLALYDDGLSVMGFGIAGNDLEIGTYGPAHDIEFGHYSNNGVFVPLNIMQGSGNVGIGTASPGRKFTVVDNTGGFSAYIVNNSPGPGTQGVLLLQVGASNDPTTSILDLLGGNGDREFFFNSAGEGRADGSFAGGGADYAEYFENLNAGVIEKCAIVALEEGKLRVAKKEDVFIAGVVSTFAGIIGNNGDIEEEREKHPEKWTLVSLMGQVPVKVRGNIKHGDYIELDDNGIGRKARQWHPEVIGRAMEDYDSEKTGKIKVMIK